MRIDHNPACWQAKHRGTTIDQRPGGGENLAAVTAIDVPSVAIVMSSCEVERRFAELTRKQIQRGVHTSDRQLEAGILTFIDPHNQNPKPFK
jgi:hypothetical protein